MIAKSTALTPHFLQYADLLRQLHALIGEGKGNSAEAEALRDAMDKPWYQMSPDEIKRARGLSADLYSFCDREAPPPDLGGKSVSEEELKGARERRDWDRVLELLRYRPTFLAPAQIAWMRGNCWNSLGDRTIALLFYEFATALEPSDPEYSLLLAHYLITSGRSLEAVTLIERIIQGPAATSPGVLLRAATVLFAAALELPDRENEAITKDAADLILRAFEIDAGIVPTTISAPDVARYLVYLGLCYFRLSERSRAVQAWYDALRIDPDGEIAGEARHFINVAAPALKQELAVPQTRERFLKDIRVHEFAKSSKLEFSAST